ncbi:hypothetical protein [Mucilaginibacter sp. UR6-11]|uniref:hypothetical protein n=1 Tax=Mucilaginibacter sp. UR6-11 TaxID=1435644 RepID=UPI001E449DC0|nr:hypothetical protein [Mucilaginibacter sp. UR6-11]MCC8426834.1 hypothetical protein [Mucilaginibacter sp. UR6-11]
MKKNYPNHFPVLLGTLFLILFATSCKKEPKFNPTVSEPVNYARLGLYEQVSGNNRRIFIAVPKLGDVTTINYGLVFDTGSTGMTIDADGIIPASMISANGFVFTGDSVNVNGITITSQQSTITYGGIDGAIQEYGNLAYAKVTIGDGNGSTVTPRIPIFLYYKIVNLNNGQQLAAHSADVFGVASGVMANSRKIASPLSYFKLADNVTSGFRLAMLNSANFETTATYTPGLLYIGLTPAELNSSGFIMHPLTYNAISGYSPNISSSITYNGKTIPGTILFDTGTPTTTIVEDATAASNSAALPVNSAVSITTGQGFNYQYTTTSNFNLTQVENPSYSKDNRTIFSIDFFLSNEYLLDYTNNRIGLKNN